MTDVAVRDEEPGGGEVATRPTPTVARLADWAVEARAAHQLATSLCATSFVPDHFRGKPAEATAAILTGHEMGMSPMAALRSIYVIKGTPGMYANAMRAVLQSQGHRIWVVEAGPTRVVVHGQRAGEPEVTESVWTIDRAKQAGLTNNPQYQRNPQNMLTARATAEVCRLIAADALHGIPYAVEELDDAREPIRVEASTPRVTAAEIMGTPADVADEPVPAAPAEAPPVEPDAEDWPETAPGGQP